MNRHYRHYRNQEHSIAVAQHICYIEISLFFLNCNTDERSLLCRQIFIMALTFTSRAVSPFKRSIRVIAILSLYESFARNSETTPPALETWRAAV